jgi:hypothetical protein
VLWTAPPFGHVTVPGVWPDSETRDAAWLTASTGSLVGCTRLPAIVGDSVEATGVEGVLRLSHRRLVDASLSADAGFRHRQDVVVSAMPLDVEGAGPWRPQLLGLFPFTAGAEARGALERMGLLVSRPALGVPDAPDATDAPVHGARARGGALVARLPLFDGTWLVRACRPSGECTTPSVVAVDGEAAVGRALEGPAEVTIVGEARGRDGGLVRSGFVLLTTDGGSVMSDMSPSGVFHDSVPRAWLTGDRGLEIAVSDGIRLARADWSLDTGRLPVTLDLATGGAAEIQVFTPEGREAGSPPVTVVAWRLGPEPLSGQPEHGSQGAAVVSPKQYLVHEPEPGRVRVLGLRPGRHVVELRIAGLVPWRSSDFGIEDGDLVDLGMATLAHGCAVTGAVLDRATRSGVEGATVSVVDETGLASETDGQGRFALAGIPVGNHTLSVDHPRYTPETVLVSLDDEHCEPAPIAVDVVELDARRDVEVRVVDPTGLGLDHVLVLLEDSSSLSGAAVRTDSDGRAHFEGVAGRDQALTVVGVDGDRVVASDQGLVTVTATGPGVTGSVHRAGQPLPAVVVAEAGVVSRLARGGWPASSTFRVLPVLDSPSLVVSVWVMGANGQLSSFKRELPSPRDGQELLQDIHLDEEPEEEPGEETRPETVVEGAIVDAGTGEPLAGWYASVPGSAVPLARSGDDGRFALRVPGDGEYLVWPRSSRLRESSRAGIAESQEPVLLKVDSGVAYPGFVVLAVERTPSASVRIIAGDGTPLGGVWCQVVVPGAQADGPVVTGWEARTDPTGRATLAAESAEAHRVLVTDRSTFFFIAEVSFGVSSLQVVRQPPLGRLRVAGDVGTVMLLTADGRMALRGGPPLWRVVDAASQGPAGPTILVRGLPAGVHVVGSGETWREVRVPRGGVADVAF